ncbi:DUF1566 domain-containing protein [Desulfovibrio ferrophilus]|uniref:Lcl C-terminal domain-containing protein n=1 Tax=Desulfovibrio ferrophilus TaxID=241368 RepID=A0A2Z6AW35_9BACT|nr:DUF1566 domain-containing protein [Desulfovibrio ferrophilus]BBD07454.1 uncharacterized protein DFE_0728 [Desulfovibrio ferrophilus]
MSRHLPLVFSCLMALIILEGTAIAGQLPYPIVDTGQQTCYSDTRQILCPKTGRTFSGQDAQFTGNAPAYRDNGDGTVSDLNTGLMWVKERGDKMSWKQAMRGAQNCRVGGYNDWRAPTIKELYSLIDFRGRVQRFSAKSIPYLDTRYFDFQYGDTRTGARNIDCQDWSATRYQGTTMKDQPTAFGVNFADGRIKGYPTATRDQRGLRFMRYVRGNRTYGSNDFKANGNGTVTDRATSLVWQQEDSGKTLNWQDALNYCEALNLGGKSDWRLPNAKELQSIVDYSRSPTATKSAAIDPAFSVSKIESYYWTSTTHLDGPHNGDAAVYIAFGRAMGYMNKRGSAQKTFMDVHGAGAQRSDPKSGDPAAYPQGQGPQGDDRRIYNFVRCVRGGQTAAYVPKALSALPPWDGTSSIPTGAISTGTHPRQSPPSDGQRMNQGSSGMGQQGHRGMGKQGRQGPPREAFTACENKSKGDQCSFNTPRGTMEGLCIAPQDQLVCAPANGRRGGMQ